MRRAAWRMCEMDRYDVAAAAGLVCLAIGCALVYAPLGLMVFGGGLLVAGVVGARADGFPRNDEEK
jgi:hypothetical protein